MFKNPHLLYCTLYIFGFIAFLNAIPAQFEILDPISKALSDFEMTDLVFSDMREEQPSDTNIVLVNIGHLSRADIGKQIARINEHEPAVIGIDAFFRSKKAFEDDIQLIMALSQCENLVMVSELYSPNKQNSFDSIATSHKQFNQFAQNGFANMVTAAESFKTTREFKPFAKMGDSLELSFAAKVVEKYRPEQLTELLQRQNETETINWLGHNNKFFTLDAQDVLDEEVDLSFIKGKIVLLGFLGEYELGEPSLEDTFYTPMNKQTGSKTFPDMYGVVVHANIISMILRGNYINTIPTWADALIAFIIVYLNVTLFFRVGEKFKVYYDLITKSLQIFEVSIIFFINLIVLSRFDYKVDLTIAIIALVFSGDLTELYVGSLKDLSARAVDKFRHLFDKKPT
jgi:CHASE2 domain-containing sensor protein